MTYLTDEERKKAVYLGDGLYVIDRGYDIMLFSYNGIAVLEAVYLDEHVLETFNNYLKNRKIRNDETP